MVQRDMASPAAKVPVVWVLVVTLLAALGASTRFAVAGLRETRPLWQQQNGVFAQRRLMAIQLLDVPRQPHTLCRYLLLYICTQL